MKKHRALRIFLLLLIFCISCISANAQPASAFAGSGQIPDDMEKENFVLIGILKDNNNRDKMTRTAFEKYTGPYVLCKREELDEKYPDKDKYRYVLDYKEIRESENVYSTYSIYDRKENAIFSRAPVSDFGREIREYLAAIEKVRKK